MSSIVRKLTQFTQKEIDTQFHNARCVFKNPALTILLAPRLIHFGRVLIVTPRKVGSAPERNKIRRRIKSIFYQEKFFEQPYDCILLVRKEATLLSFVELKKILVEQYEKKNSSHC